MRQDDSHSDGDESYLNLLKFMELYFGYFFISVRMLVYYMCVCSLGYFLALNCTKKKLNSAVVHTQIVLNSRSYGRLHDGKCIMATQSDRHHHEASVDG